MYHLQILSVRTCLKLRTPVKRKLINDLTYNAPFGHTTKWYKLKTIRLSNGNLPSPRDLDLWPTRIKVQNSTCTDQEDQLC